MSWCSPVEVESRLQDRALAHDTQADGFKGRGRTGCLGQVRDQPARGATAADRVEAVGGLTRVRRHECELGSVSPAILIAGSKTTERTSQACSCR